MEPSQWLDYTCTNNERNSALEFFLNSPTPASGDHRSEDFQERTEGFQKGQLYLLELAAHGFSLWATPC